MFPLTSLETAVYTWAVSETVSEPETVTVVTVPGTTVTTLPPDTPLVMPVAVIVTVPARNPVMVFPVRVTEPVSSVWVQL